MLGNSDTQNEKQVVDLGLWRGEEFERIIRKAAQMRGAGRRIEFISRQFLGTDYEGGTLCGSEETPERLVVNFSGVDCFTFLDYVESFRLSDSFLAFKDNLARVRYRAGIVAFERRNHFFSDWITSNRDFVEDVTKQVGRNHALSSRKELNVKDDGTFYLSGITPVVRTIHYIPADAINTRILGRLRIGDYIGIYTEDPGLDATHVGIFIRSRGKTYLRHASSRSDYRKVVDQDFPAYMVDKSGFFVLRPRSFTPSST